MKTETGVLTETCANKTKLQECFDDGFNILKWLKPQITDFA